MKKLSRFRRNRESGRVPVFGLVLLLAEVCVLQGLLDLHLLAGAVHPRVGLLVLVVPVLDDQRHDSQADSDKDDDENAA